MREQKSFESDWEYRELRRMLSEAISRGHVEQVPVLKLHPYNPNEQWYRDRETGEIYTLTAPEEKQRGWWARVDPEDHLETGGTVQ